MKQKKLKELKDDVKTTLNFIFGSGLDYIDYMNDNNGVMFTPFNFMGKELKPTVHINIKYNNVFGYYKEETNVLVIPLRNKKYSYLMVKSPKHPRPIRPLRRSF